MTLSYADSLRKDMPKDEGSRISMQIHEICSIFPLMNDEEYAGLKADIAANGQREPIWTYQGKVVDGRNRLKACEELGLEPTTKEWTPGDGQCISGHDLFDLVSFVISENLHRRHLDSSQKAMALVLADRILGVQDRESAAAKERHRAGSVAGGKRSGAVRGGKAVQRIAPPSATDEPKGKSRSRTAWAFGTNHKYVADAREIEEKAPELVAKILAGEKTIPQAQREVRRAEKRAELEAKAAAAATVEHPTWEIREGDCVDVLATVEPGSVRLAFLDVPYNEKVNYGAHYDDDLPPERYLARCRAWFEAASRVLSEDGSIWVLTSSRWGGRTQCLLEDLGLHYRETIIWHESFGVYCEGTFGKDHRPLYRLTKSRHRQVFHPDRVPSSRQTTYDDPRADPEGRVPSNVWRIARVCGTHAERLPDFPTQLPLALLRRVIGCASDPGDLVLDPFAGSATTGVAAIELGRRFLGVELSSEFAHRARQRLKTTKGSDTASVVDEVLDAAADAGDEAI